MWLGYYSNNSAEPVGSSGRVEAEAGRTGREDRQVVVAEQVVTSHDGTDRRRTRALKRMSMAKRWMMLLLETHVILNTPESTRMRAMEAEILWQEQSND